MIDKTETSLLVQYALEELELALHLLNSTSPQQKLKANRRFLSARSCALKATERIQDPQSNVLLKMKDVILTCEKYLPADIEASIEQSREDYKIREKEIRAKVFGRFNHQVREESEHEWEIRYFDYLRGIYEKYPSRYGFLTQEKFIDFFNDTTFIYDNGYLGYRKDACYTDLVLEFDMLFLEMFDYFFYRQELKLGESVHFGEIWASMRKKYCGGKPYVQIDEMMAEGRLEQFTADETVAALWFCVCYKERFCDGYFLDCCEEGIIGKLLLHLKEVDPILPDRR